MDHGFEVTRLNVKHISQIIYLFNKGQKMSQVSVTFLRKRRMTATQGKPKPDSIQSSDFKCKEGDKFTLKELSREIIRLLNCEVYVSHKETETLNSLKKLEDVLAFLRNFPRGKQVKNGEKIEHGKGENSCEHLGQIQLLKKKLESKNQVVVKLSEGYKEAKELFDKELSSRESSIMTLKKQICQFKAENEILKQKVETLMNYRQRKSNQKQESKSNHNNNGSELSMAGSRRSSCHEINDLFSATETKIDNSMSSEKESNQTEKVNARGGYQTEAKKFYTPIKVTRLTDFQGSTRECERNPSQRLLDEVNELRDNQSMLLDRIFERDEMIAELLKMKNKVSSFKANQCI